MGTILVMNGGRLLAFELGMNKYLQLYTSASTIFAILIIRMIQYIYKRC